MKKEDIEKMLDSFEENEEAVRKFIALEEESMKEAISSQNIAALLEPKNIQKTTKFFEEEFSVTLSDGDVKYMYTGDESYLEKEES